MTGPAAGPPAGPTAGPAAEPGAAAPAGTPPGAVRRLGSGGPWEESIGYCRVVRAGDWLLTAGCTATVDGEVRSAGDAYAQAVQAFGVALDALARLGAGASDVVRTRMYVVRRADCDPVGRAHRELFAAVRPAATMILVAGLMHPDHLVEVEVEAYRPVPAGEEVR